MTARRIVEAQLKLERDPRGVIVAVRAQAGARRNAVVGVREGMLRVAVTAAPEKGKANKAIVDVLSKALGVAKSAVVLISGATSPQKRLLVVSDDVVALTAALEHLAAGS